MTGAEPPPLLVVMGIAGAGKSTLASALVDKLGWTFLEADSFHSAGNIERMRRGDALGAAERDPWVRRIGAAIMELEGQPCALACSALTAPVRDALRESSGGPYTGFVSKLAMNWREPVWGGAAGTSCPLHW